VTMEGHIRSMATIDDFKGHQRRQWTMVSHNGVLLEMAANDGQSQWRVVEDGSEWWPITREMVSGDDSRQWPMRAANNGR
jgi:hypothetical protein